MYFIAAGVKTRQKMVISGNNKNNDKDNHDDQS